MLQQFQKQQMRFQHGSHWHAGPGIVVLTLCEIESVSEAWLEYGVEETGFGMEAERFSVKGTVVLVRSTSVAEVVGWVSIKSVWEDRANEMSLEAHFCP